MCVCVCSFVRSFVRLFLLDSHHISHVIRTRGPSDVIEIFISYIASTTPKSFMLKLLVNILLVDFIITICTSISHNDMASCDILDITH